MYFIGLNCFHANSSICLFKDEKLIFAIEEERLNRKKNWYGFPKESLAYILNKKNLKINQISSFCINFNPNQNFSLKLLTVLKNPFILKKLNFLNKSKYSKTIESLKYFGLKDEKKIFFFDHHHCHIFYSYYTSNFDKSLVVSIDGFGDQKSSLISYFDGKKFQTLQKVFFPHSLGIFYQAFTQFLGFKNYGDEYKVMGMSAYGKKYIKDLDKVIAFDDKSLFKLNLKFFSHHVNNIEQININSQINYTDLYSKYFVRVFSKYSKFDLAYSVQKKYEEILFKIINKFSFYSSNLCLTGGCALNSLANGKLYENCPKIKKIHINSTPHDAGGCIGAVYFYFFYNKKNFLKRINTSFLYTGPKYTNKEVKKYIDKNENDISFKMLDKNTLIQYASTDLKKGKVIGWFQDNLEWGPRSLGNRSILANPGYKNMKAIINKKIKRRESFRPFAPSILEEKMNNWFHAYEKEPYMIKVYKFLNNKKKLVPSVVHKDGTGRLQTVNKKNNKKYYQLINSFYKKTKIPLVLNTSFNENEPVVNHPKEAIDCFLRNDLDSLYINNFFIYKKNKFNKKKLNFRKDVSIILITYNEEIHIERILKNLIKYNKNIFVVDSYSTDGTVSILEKYSINYRQRKFKGYSDQINWAILNNPFNLKFTFRIDADELINKKLIDEINFLINKNINGVFIKRNISFMGKLLKFGNQSESFILRLWKSGYGYSSDDFVDEQIIVKKGILVKSNNFLTEINLKSLYVFIKKHIRYSKLESMNYFLNKDKLNTLNHEHYSNNRQNKYNYYYKSPIFLRAFFYFLYILIIKSGYRDGVKGILYYFIQSFCYRFLVDLNILKLNIIKWIK